MGLVSHVGCTIEAGFENVALLSTNNMIRWNSLPVVNFGGELIPFLCGWIRIVKTYKCSYESHHSTSDPLGVDRQISDYVGVDRQISDHVGVDRQIIDHLDVDRQISVQLGVDRQLSDQLCVDRQISDQLGEDRQISDHVGVDRQLSDQLGVDRQISDQLGVDRQISDQLGVDRQLSDSKLQSVQSMTVCHYFHFVHCHQKYKPEMFICQTITSVPVPILAEKTVKSEIFRHQNLKL